MMSDANGPGRGKTANLGRGALLSGAVIDKNIEIGNPEGTGFSNGRLHVHLDNATPDDQLMVAKSGDISVSGNDVLFKRKKFATWTGGEAGTDLVVLFGPDVAKAEVQPLLRAIALKNASPSPPMQQRNVTYTVVDAEGDVGAIVIPTVIGATRPPVLSN